MSYLRLLCWVIGVVTVTNIPMSYAEKMVSGDSAQPSTVIDDGIDGSYVAKGSIFVQRNGETFQALCQRVKKTSSTSPAGSDGFHVRISGTKIHFDDCSGDVVQAYVLKRGVKAPAGLDATYNMAIETTEDPPKSAQECWRKMGGRTGHPASFFKGVHHFKRCDGFLFFHISLDNGASAYHVLSPPAGS